MATNNAASDPFTKWILGIAAVAIVTGGGWIMSKMQGLSEDVAVIKSEMQATNGIELKVNNHEYRIGTIELVLEKRSRIDNTRSGAWLEPRRLRDSVEARRD